MGKILSKYRYIFTGLVVLIFLTGCGEDKKEVKDYIQVVNPLLVKSDTIKSSVEKGIRYEEYTGLINDFKAGCSEVQNKEKYISGYYLGMIKYGLERTELMWKERLGKIDNPTDFDQWIKIILEKECFPYIQKAKEALQAEESSNPQKVWLRTVERLLETKNYEEAAQIAEAGIKIYPEDNRIKEKNEIASKAVLQIESHFSKGLELLNKSDYNEAITEFKKILEIAPEHTDVLALIQIANERNAEVPKTLAEAKSLTENKKYKKAMEKYKIILEMAPGNEVARAGFDAMEKIMKKGASIPDSDMDTYMNGETESVSIKLTSGIQLTGTIVNRTPEEVVIKTSVGTIKCIPKDIVAETAISVSDVEVLSPMERYEKKRSQATDNDAVGHYLLWLFCFKNALNNQAEEEYLKTVRVDESYDKTIYETKARIIYESTYGLYQQQRWTQAAEKLDKIIKDFPDSKICHDAKRLLDICLDKSYKEQWVQSHKCDRCSGSGKCSSCTGKGKVKCNICKGSGVSQIVEKTSAKCLHCNGTGRRNVGRSTSGQSTNRVWDARRRVWVESSNSVELESNVPTKNEEECTHCDGKGYLRGEKVGVACNHCIGKGEIKCQICKGTGVCSTCSGKGFIGVPPESTPPKVVPKEPEKIMPRLCWGCRGAGYYNLPGDEAVRKVCRLCRGIGYLP